MRAPMDGRTRILVTGATGLVGQRLVRRLLDAGHEVEAWSRDPERAVRVLPARCRVQAWDTRAAIEPRRLGGIGAVVHLAGEPVAAGRWTVARRAAIRDSRVESSRALVAAIAALPRNLRPQALVAASAIGIYGDRGDQLLDENAAAGSGFLADVCRDWEAATQRAADFGVRTAVLRIGLVLDPDGGLLRAVLPPFRLGLGGRLGSGRQWMSWIHRDDMVELLLRAIEDPAVSGVINAVAPQPVANAAFALALGRALRRPARLPVPAVLLRLLAGELAGVMAAGQRVVPRAAEALGVRFRFPDLAGALADLCADLSERIDREQWVPLAPEALFPFYADPVNLERITPPFLRFRVVHSSDAALRDGALIDYRLRLHGLPISWRSRIETWRPPAAFVDQQVRGPYALWHHLHTFEPHDGGTVVRDQVRYRLPGGALGQLVAGRLVARDLAHIFDYRRAVVARLFAAAPPAAEERRVS